jgi:hypothetical protein
MLCTVAVSYAQPGPVANKLSIVGQTGNMQNAR